MITAEAFEAATGRRPEQDDLERCNCTQAGEAGHVNCGWNKDTHLPVFFGKRTRSTTYVFPTINKDSK